MDDAGFKSTAGLAVLVLALAGLQADAARGAVTDVSVTGFELAEAATIMAPADKVYAVLITPSQWWSAQHTFSGSASNMSLNAHAGGCWCETLPDGGSVLHMTVVFADPGKTLRLRGALGPFQATGMEGAMTFALKADGAATSLTLVADFGGYIRGGFGDLPKSADAVLAEQISRLKKFVETGSPETHQPH